MTTDEQKNDPDTATAIYRELRRNILSLEIKPGQAITESDTCKQFGASRTPVREAFQRLGTAGLLKTVPYRGSYATLLSMNQIIQYIYLRFAVETMVLTDFLHIVTPFDIEKLRYSLNVQQVLLKTDFTAAQFYEYDSAFHRVWFKKTNRELLWNTIQRAQIQYKRFRMLDIVAVHNFTQIVDEHEELFYAIEQKDAASIKPLTEKHLHGGIKRLGDRIHTEFASYFIPEERERLPALSKI